jgi:hypothetical protein
MKPKGHFETKLKELLNQKAEDICISTGFIKRARKIKGSSFAKAMVLGNIGKESSLEEMCELFSQEKISLTKQGLDLRFTQASVDFMKALYQEAFGMMDRSLKINCPVLKLFKSVKLLDSSYINLPMEMSSQYRGYGSSYKNRKCSTQAGLKLQLVYDYLHQVITRLDLKEGIRSDQGYKDYLQDISPGDLLMADLGYFAPNSFKYIHENHAYFISRYKADTNLYDPLTQEKINLVELLKNKTFLNQELLLGSQVKLKVSIVGQKLTPDQSAHRRRKANSLAKSHKYISSPRNQHLLEWALFITNIPAHYIAAEDLAKLYRLRWQIELLFKLYKNCGRIDKFYSKNPHRVLCQIYAKLVGMIIFHDLANCFKTQPSNEFSLVKAFTYFKNHSRELFLALSKKAKYLRLLIKNILTSWSVFSLKDRYRKSRLSTLNSLNILPITLRVRLAL